MSIPANAPLAPLLRKLMQHSKIDEVGAEALLSLPVQLATKDRGSHLVREGDKANTCFVLLSGFACRSKVTGDGAKQILSVHMCGDLVDLQNSLLGVADHSVQTLSRIEVAHIPHRVLLDVATAHPSIAQALWRDTLIDGSIFREWILNVGHRDARQRISHFLCEFVLRQQWAGLSDGPSFEWPMTQEEVGYTTGLTTVHVNRTIQGMKIDKLIAMDRRSVTILDWPGLQIAGDFKSAYLHQGNQSSERLAS